MAANAAWTVVCGALGALWIVAASWTGRSGFARSAVRGALGGIAAVGAASGGFALLQLAGIDLAWERLRGDPWTALGMALLVGLVEEGAKLTGLTLVVRPDAGREAYRTSAAVAALFAVFEASVTMRGQHWLVATTRAVLAPVAHAALAIPLAFAVAQGRARGRPHARVGVALAVAAALHGLGDLALAQDGWGRIGFAAAMLVPVLWLYDRERLAPPITARPLPPAQRA